MAGPSIGTWVKVKNKSGRLTARVIPNKFGGGGYSQGEVITQSEFQKVQKERVSQMDARKRQLERKKERANEDELVLRARGTTLDENRAANRKRQQEIKSRIDSNQSLNKIGPKGKTQNREFTIAQSDGDAVVKGSVRGAFGVHQDKGLVVLTHLPTGMAIVRLQKKMVRPRGGGELNTTAQVKKEALSLADKLNNILGVDKPNIAKNGSTLKEMRDVITSNLDGRF